MPTRLTRFIAVALAAAVLAATAACASTGVPRESSPPTYLSVENRNFLDMNIYVWRNTERIRLGTARGSATTRLRIPDSILTGPTPLRFQADPVGGNATPLSMEVLVSPGEEVGISIPA